MLPSTLGQYASYDVEEFPGSGVGAGASVYLSGVAGLPAGVYPLLPASYALLPGAFLVQAEPGYHSITPGKIGTLTDGTAVTAGYLTFGDSGLQNSSGYTGFAVRPGNYAQSLAQYTITDASTYFAAAAASSGVPAVLPADAGTLLIAASSTLNATGKVNSAAGTGGSAATIEISATDLTVTATPQTVAGSVSISAPVLTSWNAGDLILGGQLAPNGTSLDVTATNLTIGPGALLSAGQVLAVADQSIEVDSGAIVSSTSGASGAALKTLPATTALSLTHQDPTSTQSSLVADNGAALLAVSDTALPIVTRSGSAATSGIVQLDSGATLSTRGAVALDAPGGVAVADGANINAPGASWSLASNNIAFVPAGGVPSGTTPYTLQIDPTLLSQMQGAGAIQLSSAGSIDLLTTVALGAGGASSAPTLGLLGLTAGSINNVAGGDSVFGGKTVVLQGVATNSPSAPISGSGTLTFVADTLDIGAAAPTNNSASSSTSTTPAVATNLTIGGNSLTTLQVSGAVVGQGSVNLAIAGNTTIAASELTAASRSDTAVSAPDGTLTILQNGKADLPSSLVGSLGGQLSLSANSIQDSGTIIVPGGRISLTAAADPNAPTNAGGSAASSDITLASTAVINANGITVSAGDQTIGAAGGIVDITAAGNLTLSPGAAISVSGAASGPGATDAPAGYLSLTGGGAVTLGATLTGSAASDAIGGNFWLDAGQLVGGLPALANTLTAGGFNNLIDIRVRSGDLDSAAGTTLTANQITLTADTGVIDIAGTLNAPSAGLRGSIGLFAGNGVTLSGSLLANGTGSASGGSAGSGGEIELSTVSGWINLETGSTISATGATADLGGSLLLRAPAVVNTGDVNITSIGSTVSLQQITIEPVLALTTTAPGGGLDLGQYFNQQIEPLVSTYLNNVQSSGAIAQRFPQPASNSGQAKVVLEPGVALGVTGDVSLSPGEDLDLYALQTSGQLGAPLDLTVRATGNITLGASVSDGIAGNTLSSTPSSSFRFVAGADLGSANPLATVVGSGANLTLANNALVRTGTGDIDLVASNDVIINSGSSAYTVGYAGSPSFAAKFGGQTQINFPTGGGNVVINAGEDVVGFDQTDPQSPSNWLAREVKGGLGFWGVNLSAFDNDPWSLATFGGGDVNVSAARDVTGVSAAASDSLALVGTTQTLFASGGMTVTAGRDITTGQFLVADGIGSFNAGRSFATSPNQAAAITGSGETVGSIFELENSRVSLWAQDSITIEGILNPTVLLQPLATAGTANFYYFTYGANSAFNAQSSSGTVTVATDNVGIETLLGSAVAINGTAQSFASTRRI